MNTKHCKNVYHLDSYIHIYFIVALPVEFFSNTEQGKYQWASSNSLKHRLSALSRPREVEVKVVEHSFSERFCDAIQHVHKDFNKQTCRQ